MSLFRRTENLVDESEVRFLDHILASRTETVGVAARGLI